LNQAIQAAGVGPSFRLIGFAPNLVYAACDANGQPSQPFRTLFLQEIIKRGVLAPSFVVSFSHSDEDIDRTVDAVGAALKVYRKALDSGVEGYLVGRPVQPVFRRRN
jgi:glutamate-1-semialdehyde 2,1-aminomutase